MKKKIIFLLIICLFFLVGCSSEERGAKDNKEEKETYLDFDFQFFEKRAQEIYDDCDLKYYPYFDKESCQKRVSNLLDPGRTNVFYRVTGILNEIKKNSQEHIYVTYTNNLESRLIVDIDSEIYNDFSKLEVGDEYSFICKYKSSYSRRYPKIDIYFGDCFVEK